MRLILSGLLRYLYIPFLVFMAVIQVTVMPDFQISDGRADLVFVLVMGWTLLAGGSPGVIWALVAGLAQDLLTGVPLGVSALALATIAFIIGQLIKRSERVFVLLTPLVIGVGTLGYHVVLMGLFIVTRQSVAISYSLIHATLPGMILNGLLSIPVIVILGWVRRATRPRRVSALTQP